MKSLAEKIAELAPLIGTGDITRWEDEFLRNAVNFTRPGSQTEAMSPKQVEIVERLYRKHFADAEA